MIKFGSLKTKMLKKLTESYMKNDKSDIKEILDVLKEDKDLKEMYLLYEEIENKHFDDENTSKFYVDELASALKGKNKNIKNIIKKMNESFGDMDIVENEIYDVLDLLSEEDSLLNIDKKVTAKKKLVSFLNTKKQINETKVDEFSKNENLLHAVLTNNFNIVYDNTLSESEKEEFKEILSINNEELENRTNKLKESILVKVNTLLTESEDNDVISKLKDVKEEVNKMNSSKYNYFKLTQLKNGLD
jgi:hypothetical protein